MVTGDENRILYKHVVRKKSLCLQRGDSTTHIQRWCILEEGYVLLLVNSKGIVHCELLRENEMHSGGHFSGHVNTHSARIWSLENPHEVLESQRDSPKLKVLCAISQRKVDEAHFWLNGYVNKQKLPHWSEANPQVYVETPLHPEKLTVWCALWAGGILLQKR
ncbi:hypothetical protein TNCV_4096831 [Trichonephila clavipes]|nr:hypothetical protein TNCV_4096831 [Trichonephila clavipes]